MSTQRKSPKRVSLSGMDDGYEVRLWWSQEDACYLARVPELEGCITHGYTPEEALKMVQEAKELWLESALRHGDRIPEPSHRKKAALSA